MRGYLTKSACTALAAAMLAGATPALADVGSSALLTVQPGVRASDQLGKEMTVNNWILCTSQDNAESIAKARAGGVEPALKVYDDLQHNRACGVFPALRVILQQALYDSGSSDPHETRVYRAAVSLGGGWPTGFVVYGGLAD